MIVGARCRGGDFSLSDGANARRGAQDDAEAQEARLVDKLSTVFSAKFNTLADTLSDKIHEALDAERGASHVSPSGDARRVADPGNQADLPALDDGDGYDDDVASSALSGWEIAMTTRGQRSSHPLASLMPLPRVCCHPTRTARSPRARSALRRRTRGP